MNRISLCAFSLAATLGSFPAAHAADPIPTAPPVAPVVAPAPATPTVPTVPVVIDIPAAPAPPNAPVEDLQAIKDRVGRAVRAGVMESDRAKEIIDSAMARIYFVGQQSLPETPRVNLDEKNTHLKDVLKNLLDQAKVDYVLDGDLPNDSSISIRVVNIRLSSALNAITDMTALSWWVEWGMGKPVVHIGKTPAPTAGRSLYDKSDHTVHLIHPGDVYNTTPPLFYQQRSQETRSTFTCPNCHNQITVLRKNVDAKCSTCGREFQPGWKVCPFDGTKRPAAQDDWKFCPVCGKAIPDSATSFNFSPDEDYAPLVSSLTPSVPSFSYGPVPATPLPRLVVPAPGAAKPLVIPPDPSVDYR